MTANNGFLNAILVSSALPVYLVRSSDPAHGACWYYVEVERAKHAAFKKTMRSGQNFALDDFGRIISSGWGEEPPQDTVELLRDERVITVSIEYGDNKK